MAPYILADTSTAYGLIRRLVVEYGSKHWKLYTAAFALMAIGAACTALTAYLMGTVVNEAYVNRSFAGIVTLGIITIFIFMARGGAAYGHSVILSRIGNSIIAENQRRLFDRLMNQNLGFFAERHSSVPRNSWRGCRPAPMPPCRCSICWSPRSDATCCR
jgi:ATP-binding cassette subfamily B protein